MLNIILYIYRHTGRTYTPPGKPEFNDDSVDVEGDYEDLGWKTFEGLEKDKQKGKGRADAESAAAIAEEERREEATVGTD